MFRGYTIVTGYWIDENWNLYSTALALKRHPTPHTGDAALTNIQDVILGSRLAGSMKAITRDNMTDMVAGMTELRANLKTITPGEFSNTEGFHNSCIAHVINVDITDCMGQVQHRISKKRKLFSSIRSYVKRRELFESVKELYINCKNATLD